MTEPQMTPRTDPIVDDVRPVDERMADLTLVGEALARAVTEALKKHKLAGNPVAEWRDGRVRWVQPSEIPVG